MHCLLASSSSRECKPSQRQRLFVLEQGIDSISLSFSLRFAQAGQVRLIDSLFIVPAMMLETIIMMSLVRMACVVTRSCQGRDARGLEQRLLDAGTSSTKPCLDSLGTSVRT